MNLDHAPALVLGLTFGLSLGILFVVFSTGRIAPWLLWVVAAGGLGMAVALVVWRWRR